MQVECLATINLPEEGWDVDALEQQCREAARCTGRELFIQPSEQRGERVTAEATSDKKDEFRRYLLYGEV